MWMSRPERVTLSVLGGVLLVLLSALLWQQQRAPLVITTVLPEAVHGQWDRALDAAQLVNINTADVAALTRLPAVGPALAARIVAHRDEHGQFRSADDLREVRGIGPKTVERVRGYVRVQ